MKGVHPWPEDQWSARDLGRAHCHIAEHASADEAGLPDRSRRSALGHVAMTAKQAHDQLTPKGDGPGSGHIGVIVVSSVVVGLVLGLVLDILVFGGGRETVITGL